MPGYSVFLISSRYVIMQNLHDGKPRNGTRNGAYYCSAKSTGPFEGSHRFKVELLSFDITRTQRGRAQTLFSKAHREWNSIWDILLLAKPQGPSTETYPLRLCFFFSLSPLLSILFFFSSRTKPGIRYSWFSEFSEAVYNVMEVCVHIRPRTRHAPHAFMHANILPRVSIGIE